MYNLSIVGLKLNHVSKRRPRGVEWSGTQRQKVIVFPNIASLPAGRLGTGYGMLMANWCSGFL